MEYTKGEWKALPYGDGRWYIDSPDTQVAQVQHYLNRPRETEANARLISSAPDLYEALKALLRKTKLWTGTGKYQDLLLELVDIEQALAKAEGK